MSAIFLSTESQSPAAQMIIDCFIEIQQNMDIVSLDKYTDAISTISIIPFCVDEEFKNTFACKERKYIGWKRKEADIRLLIPFIPFVQASKEEKLSICKEIIKKSLTEIHARCMVKKVRFDLETLLCDIFPSKWSLSNAHIATMERSTWQYLTQMCLHIIMWTEDHHE